MYLVLYTDKNEEDYTMLRNIIKKWNGLDGTQRRNILVIAAGSILALGLIIYALSFIGKDDNSKDILVNEAGTSTEMEVSEVVDTEIQTEEATKQSTEEGTEVLAEAGTEIKEDLDQTLGTTLEEGASVDISQVINNINENETEEITLGIDVAKYQGTIDWQQVAASGVDFVMVRVGNRTQETGLITEDSNAKYNMQEATKYGIKVGVYFFSTAISKEEALEEADWVADYISKYQITYPVVYNCEGFENPENRQYSLTKTQRTDFAISFLERIKEHGYTPMFYAAKGELEGDAKWETSRLEGKYKIWVAQYPNTPYPITPNSSYMGQHAMWQYTNQGTVPGIKKAVDMNVAYFGYRSAENAQDSETPEHVEADVEALLNFIEVNETVTAKEKTNLRNIPSQDTDSMVMYTLTNGEVVTRTGISDSGWSRVILNGNVYYAVSSYLTTDLSYQPSVSVPEPDDGVQTTFTAVDELVTAKELINLRTLPSVTHPDAQVVAQVANGEVIRRTGINTDVGWSRVEYNGQILYCVSSYLTIVQ